MRSNSLLTDFQELLSKNRALENENKKLKNFQDLFPKLVKEAIDTSKFTLSPEESWKNISVETKPLLPDSREGDVTAMILLSDWHHGCQVEASETDGLNTFSPQISRERFKIWEQKVEEILDNQNKIAKIKRLVVFAIGDIGDGESMRAEHNFHTGLNLLEQLIESSVLFAQVLKRLTAKYDIEIIVLCAPGNHGRIGPFGQQHFLTNLDMFDYVMTKAMVSSKECSDKLKMFIYPAWQKVIRLDGMNIFFTHGNYGISKTFTGMNISAMAKAAYHQKSLRGINLDLMIAGHYHRPADFMIDNTRVIVNGGFTGLTQFEYNSLIQNKPPIQKVLMVNPEEGVTSVHDIMLAPRFYGQKSLTDLGRYAITT